MKLQSHIKYIMVLLLIFIGYQFVSMSSFSPSAHHGTLVGIENDVSFSLTDHQHEDEKKHSEHFGSLYAIDLDRLITLMTIHLLFPSVLFFILYKPFLHAVYYQSSYYSTQPIIYSE